MEPQKLSKYYPCLIILMDEEYYEFKQRAKELSYASEYDGVQYWASYGKIDVSNIPFYCLSVEHSMGLLVPKGEPRYTKISGDPLTEAYVKSMGGKEELVAIHTEILSSGELSTLIIGVKSMEHFINYIEAYNNQNQK